MFRDGEGEERLTKKTESHVGGARREPNGRSQGTRVFSGWGVNWEACSPREDQRSGGWVSTCQSGMLGMEASQGEKGVNGR